MLSAAKVELGVLYIMARKAIYICIIFDELGHTQPHTHIQTDNSTAKGIINNQSSPSEPKP